MDFHVFTVVSGISDLLKVFAMFPTVFAQLFLVLALYFPSVLSQCPNNLAIYNPNIRTACTNESKIQFISLQSPQSDDYSLLHRSNRSRSSKSGRRSLQPTSNTSQ